MSRLLVSARRAAGGRRRANLDANAPDEAVSLGCGIEAAADDVGMLAWLESAPHTEVTTLCGLVNARTGEVEPVAVAVAG